MIRPSFTPTFASEASNQPGATAEFKLFCFPYAGGNATAFRTWYKGLPGNIQVHPVQLPGRANRLREPVPDSFAQLIDSLLLEMVDAFNCSFAFFGHSMGAIVAFEVARTLRRHRLPLPVHLFLSGHRAPHVPSHRAPIHALSDEDLVAVVRRLGGTPAEVLASPELLQLVLPTLRADFRLCETYRYGSDSLLPTPITVFGGIDDPETTAAGLSAWCEHTSGAFRMQMLPGDHFFVHSAESTLLEHIGAELDLIARASSRR